MGVPVYPISRTGEEDGWEWIEGNLFMMRTSPKGGAAGIGETVLIEEANFGFFQISLFLRQRNEEPPCTPENQLEVIPLGCVMEEHCHQGLVFVNLFRYSFYTKTHEACSSITIPNLTHKTRRWAFSPLDQALPSYP